MANLKELKNRIKSVNDTKKITNAMYLISSNKMNKAKREFESTKPYFDLLKEEIISVFNCAEEIDCKYFVDDKEDENGIYGYLVISSDKGLCGAYNENIVRLAVPELNKREKKEVYVIGEYARNYLKSRNIKTVEDFRYLATNPTLRRAREIANRFLMDFYDRRMTKLFVIYTDFQNAMVGGIPKIVKVLPFDREEFVTEGKERQNISFYPSPEDVLKSMVESYLTGYIYSILVSSFSSEQVERRNAMDNANKNAKEILDDLSLRYNRARQDKITGEIIEVSAGAKAKKKKESEGGVS